MLRFVYSDGGLYWAYRVLRFMYSDGGLYRSMGKVCSINFEPPAVSP